MFKNEERGSAVVAVLAVIGVIVALVVLSIGAWQLGWFVEEKNVDRRVGIDNRNKGTQIAWHDEAVKTIADFELIPEDNTAARGALRVKACGLIDRLVPPYSDNPTLVRFDAKECS